MKKIPIIGLLTQFAGYKYSLCEYLYGFCAEAQQTAGRRKQKPPASLLRFRFF
jgi:hypothetical protein